MYSCTVQALWLCTARTAHRGSRSVALLFRDHDTRRGGVVSIIPRPFFTPGKTRYPLYRRLGGPQGRPGQVRKISPPTGIRSPNRPSRRQSLYHYATWPTTKDAVQEQSMKSARSLVLVVKLKNSYLCVFCKVVRVSEGGLAQAQACHYIRRNRI